MILRLLLIAALPAGAQDVLPLSLRRSVELALAPDGNTRLELARETIAQAEARRTQSRAGLLPNVDGQLSYQSITRNLRAFGIQFPSIPGLSFSSFVGPFDVFDARATAQWNVFDYATIQRYRAAQSAVETSRRDRDTVRLQVTDTVARAYLLALRAQSEIDTAKANLELAERLVQLANTQREAGTGIGIDLTRAEVQRANERQRLLVAENVFRRDVLQLLRALDLKLDQPVQLTDKLDYNAVEPISFEQALQSALDNRPDLKAQQQRERTARLSYQAVKAERLPSVVAFGDYGAIGTSVTDSRATRTAGIALRVPVFDGGRRGGRIAENAALLRQEEIRLRDLRQQAELDLRLAFDTLRSAELQVQTAQQGLQLAQRELEQAERRYRAGLTTSVEITDAQTRLARARENRTNALFQHNLARLDLGTAIGAVDRFLP